MCMSLEAREIDDLFELLSSQPKRHFPLQGQPLDASTMHGVYIIYRGDTVLHVGRTYRGKKGLHQRLYNHLHGSSSFTNDYLNGEGSILRKAEYSYQYLVLEDARKRALLEAYATGKLCPEHIGVGE